MDIRSLLTKSGALCALLLISGTQTSAQAGDHCWSNCRVRGGSGSLYTQQTYYFDSRDSRVYAAHKYNTPVTIPVAPMVRQYNYGWGIPSARLSPIGGYTAWYPDAPYTQSGGRLPGGIYPTAYQPTDTTQHGYYYQHVPAWQPR